MGLGRIGQGGRLAAVMAVCIASVAWAQECGTTVFEDPPFGTTWATDGSPYCVVTDLEINNLIIEPGVVVLVDGNHELVVLSTITAVGTAEAPITFTAKDTNVPWQGIRFEDTQPGSELIYCDISYSDRSGLTIINSGPTIEHCTITNNSVTSPLGGGGISAVIATGNLVLTACTITDNTSSWAGGGLRADLTTGDVILTNCTIRDNSSRGHGGGIRTIVGVGGQVVLDHCDISGNTANAEYEIFGHGQVGGGAYVSGGDCAIVDCDFVANRVNSRKELADTQTLGGGAFLDTNSGQCTNSRFIGNRVDAWQDGGCGGTTASYGGGLYLNDGVVWISNCLFAGQSLTHTGCNPLDEGAGVFVGRGSALIENCTIARNDDSTGLYNSTGTMTVINSIVYFNNGGDQQIGGAATVTYSDIDNGYAGEGNIAYTPVFQGSGTSFCDLMIVPGSPCIDTGDPDPAYNDSVGCADPPHGGARNDMGAHGGPLACSWDIELCPSLANLNGDCFVNTQDFLIFLNVWAAREPIADWNDDGTINTLDFLAYLNDWVAGC